jgi:hypothetical protein
MKKLFYVALVGLFALLVLPGAVSAASSDTITVSGNIGGSIDVWLNQDYVDFGAMTAGNTYTNNTTTLAFSSNYASYTISATDLNTGTNSGKMLAGTTPLANSFQINEMGGAFHALPWSPMFTVNTGGEGWTDIGFRQQVVLDDDPGSYSITVVFTGAPA